MTLSSGELTRFDVLVQQLDVTPQAAPAKTLFKGVAESAVNAPKQEE